MIFRTVIAAAAITVVACAGASLDRAGAVALHAGVSSAEPPFSVADRALIATALGLSAADAAGLGDSVLTERLIAYGRVETGQRLRPSSVDFQWTLEPARRDVAAELRAARADGGLPAWIAGLSRTDAGYLALKAARARYAALVDEGGWAGLPAGAPLRVGEAGPAVPALRVRLAREGFIGPESGDPLLFDPELEAAVRAFQESHALAMDGVVGPATRAALNVAAVDRQAQLDANIERWRWSPATLPGDRLEVDTGEQEAVLFRRGAAVLRMRAIVGDPRHPTPMFASRIEAVILNPAWNVPTSIAVNELLPAERRSPGLLASKGIRWVGGRLQQRPGPDNALGLIKFDIPNQFGVYLHDTPGKSLFARPVRALSHGCMRLEKPRELALALLEPQGATDVSIDRAIATGATRRIDLERSLPVYVIHRTVRIEADGRVVFRPDVYGWDKKLAAALASPRPARAVEASAAEPSGCDTALGATVLGRREAIPPGPKRL